ncbi:cephalosporin hydroxylase family protein [Spirosoma flavus]
MDNQPITQFFNESAQRVASYPNNKTLTEAAEVFNTVSIQEQYSYNFTWMGRPIIQYPQDLVAMQELIWRIQPDIIIETGIAHGGSLIFYASMLELIGKGEVVGIDIDIREHNRQAIESHPMFKRIKMIQGSSVDQQIVDQIAALAAGKQTILVCLDSNHTHDHVAKELTLYSPFVTVGSYLVVFDTIVEDLPANLYNNRPWDKGDNPKTAVWEFLKKNDNFEIDHAIDNKLLISVAPEGYLKRVK